MSIPLFDMKKDLDSLLKIMQPILHSLNLNIIYNIPNVFLTIPMVSANVFICYAEKISLL